MAEFEDIKICTCGQLRMAARRVSRIYDRHLAPAGIGIAQFGILATVAKNTGASVSAIAAILEMERTTLTRNLQPLERDGLLKIEAGADQRTRAVSVTERGLVALNNAKPLWAQAQSAILTSLGEAQLAVLTEALRKTLQKVPEA